MNMRSYICGCKWQVDLEGKKISCLCPLLKIVAEKNRLKILFILKNGRHCVCEIINHLKLAQSLVSHHLADLKKAGLVSDRKEGQRIYYELTELGNKLMSFLIEFQKEKEAK